MNQNQSWWAKITISFFSVTKIFDFYWYRKKKWCKLKIHRDQQSEKWDNPNYNNVINLNAFRKLFSSAIGLAYWFRSTVLLNATILTEKFTFEYHHNHKTALNTHTQQWIWNRTKLEEPHPIHCMHICRSDSFDEVFDIRKWEMALYSTSHQFIINWFWFDAVYFLTVRLP